MFKLLTMNKLNITAIVTVLLLGGAFYALYVIQQRRRNKEIDDTIVTPKEAKDLIANPQTD